VDGAFEEFLMLFKTMWNWFCSYAATRNIPEVSPQCYSIDFWFRAINMWCIDCVPFVVQYVCQIILYDLSYFVRTFTRMAA